MFVPLVNLVFTIWVGILPGNAGPNAYGDMHRPRAGVSGAILRRRRASRRAGARADRHADGGPALDVLQRHLAPAGFSGRPAGLRSSRAAPAVENLFAAIGEGERHLTSPAMSTWCRPAAESSWRHPPFAAEIVDGVLYGRGAVDMKGGLAAMLAAALGFVAEHGSGFGGRLSFLVTGDEEGAGGQRHGQAARLGGEARRAV